MPSQTNVAAETLRTLHRIHRQLSHLRERLRRGPNLVRAHQANVARCEELSHAVQVDTKAVRMTADTKQGQLQDGESKVEKLRVQLNTASSNREYQTLQEQIAATEMANSVLADEILEALEKIDEFVTRVSDAEAALSTARSEAEKAQAEVEKEEPRIGDDIQRLEVELQQCETALPEEFRLVYQRLVRARGQDALAPIKDQYCGGCNQHVPLNMVNDLMLARPAFCLACGRLLYLPEDYAPR